MRASAADASTCRAHSSCSESQETLIHAFASRVHACGTSGRNFITCKLCPALDHVSHHHQHRRQYPPRDRWHPGRNWLVCGAHAHTASKSFRFVALHLRRDMRTMGGQFPAKADSSPVNLEAFGTLVRDWSPEAPLYF